MSIRPRLSPALGPKSADRSSQRALIIAIVAARIREILDQEQELADHIVITAQRLRSFREVARVVMPQSFERDESTATNIVAGVLQQRLSPEEYAEITRKNRLSACRKRREAGGIVDWEDDEWLRLQDLAQALRHATGRQKGRPDCAAIAAAINQEFHGGNTVRTAGAVAKILMHAYREGLIVNGQEETDVHPWSPEEDAAFEQYMRTLLHPADHQHAGSPNFNLIAMALNGQFYAEQLEEGEHVRTGSTCNRHAAIIRRRQAAAQEDDAVG